MYFSRWLRTDVLGSRKVANFTSHSHARPRQSPQRVAREPCGKPKSSNSTSRSHARPRHSPQRVAREPCGNLKSCNFKLYLAFGRSTTPIHAEGCAGPRKVATLPRVRSLDHANPCRGLGHEKLQLYLAFGRSTTPIYGKGCASRRKVGKSCNFTSRSRVRPRQSMGRVARQTEKLKRVATLPRVRALDHANPWEGLRVTPKNCNFTSRSRARPRQSM